MVLVFTASAAEGQPDGLFMAVKSEGELAVVGHASPEIAGPPTKRWRMVTVDFAKLTSAAKTLELNLFNDRIFLGHVDRMERTLSGGYALSGHLAGAAMSTLTLVVRGESVTGTVRTPMETYRIRPTQEGPHTISQIDPLKFPPPGESIPTCGVGAQRKPCDEHRKQ
ncbi:MAG: hypothetical protein OXC31_24980 [Spirochaetaceae bacterium]|nr:hypothetical protein [Spirochaetaceae bacterium]